MTLLQKTCAFARPRAASLVVSALLKAPVPISNVYCCISNDRVSQSCATPVFFLQPPPPNQLATPPFFCSRFFYFAPRVTPCVCVCVCVRLSVCLFVRYMCACVCRERHTRVHVHPRPPSDPIWVVGPSLFRLYLSRVLYLPSPRPIRLALPPSVSLRRAENRAAARFFALARWPVRAG